MPERPDQSPAASRPAAAPSYWSNAQRPLQILLFVLPLILAECVLALLLDDAPGVLAHEELLDFFRRFGVASSASLYLGGLVIVVVLLAWHVLKRDPWRIDLHTAGLMAIESLVLAIPLLVFGRVIAQEAIVPLPMAAPPVPAPEQLSIWQGLAVSIGAGLYEELLFRMLLIALVHTLLVDIAGLKHAAGAMIAVIVAAAAFTFYHPLESEPGSADISVRKLAFFFLAGLYLGGVYVLRGFGIVVGVHALYDILTLCLPGGTPDG
ncbi:MAG: CPBP family glutamic-type intramembrane protease [Planctomycetota bacterium]|jgi:hypothetical protein